MATLVVRWLILICMHDNGVLLYFMEYMRLQKNRYGCFIVHVSRFNRKTENYEKLTASLSTDGLRWAAAITSYSIKESVVLVEQSNAARNFEIS